MSLEAPRNGWGELIESAATPFVPAPGAVQSIGRYLDELLIWNRKTDLTAARTIDELVDLTVADAALIASASQGTGPARWIDVGAGAGAPGLIVAILLESVTMTLVEPRDKRVAFLRTAIGKFRLPRTVVERCRSDRLASNAWDVAVSRATMAPPLWLREGARLAGHAVWVLLAREDAPSLPGWRMDADLAYEWPLTAVPRRAVRYAPVMCQ